MVTLRQALGALPARGEPLTEQAAVTQWPLRILLVLLTLAVIALALSALRWGWVRRGRRQHVVLPDAGPEVAALIAQPAVAGKYVGTVTAGNALDRIVAGGGVARAQVHVGEQGILIDREGDGPLLLPARAIRDVTTTPGLLQRYFGRHGVLLVTWWADGRDLSSGLWFPAEADQRTVAERVRAIMEHREEMA